MPIFFPTTDKPQSVRYVFGQNAGRSETVLEVDFGYGDTEKYVVPESVVTTVATWPDFQNAHTELRASMLLKGLLQYATNLK
jgi:hypothetical protein